MERTSSLKRFLIGLLTLIMVFSAIMMFPVATASDSKDIVPQKTEPIIIETTEKVTEPTKGIEEIILEQFKEIDYTEPVTPDEAAQYSDEAIEYINFLNGLLPEETAEDYYIIYIIIQPEVERMKIINEQYCQDYDRLVYEAEIAARWEKRASEYPVATQVWLYMKNEFGWSDIVCAGIIGNMMAECGGCWTQDLDWDVKSGNGMGMIQWIGGRRSQLISFYGENPSIEEQLIFMKDELHGTNGVTKQVTDKQLNKIMNAETPEECAFAFATYFERCAEGHRAVRRDYARRAYEYFVD